MDGKNMGRNQRRNSSCHLSLCPFVALPLCPFLLMIAQPFLGKFHLMKRVMKKEVVSAVVVCLFFIASSPLGLTLEVQAKDCSNLLSQTKLPLELKTRKKALRAQWEQVDKVLVTVGEAINGKECTVRFDELFSSKTDDLLFPITHVVMKHVPEQMLAGLNVYDSAGEIVGQYEGRVPHERSGGLYGQSRSVTLYSFQYRKDGELHSLGRRLLKDDYFVRWSDIKSRTALLGQAGGNAQDRK